ncbi:Hypothetical_protein [Hexamita inflata]|uniref:Hypothetical_protein n=1 Tax=Hexamita inflata TaxID=28002 RepID=A0AA86PXC9_9EUKA|nr:Hypothetical protein HINF_LOCUS29799 [Hexamita inflata]
MPTQQRPYRALTELLADQFHLIRFLTFQKLVLASLFLFARYFLRFAREVVPLDWHCLMMVAFDALVHQLDQLLCSVLVYLFLQITNFKLEDTSTKKKPDQPRPKQSPTRKAMIRKFLSKRRSPNCKENCKVNLIQRRQ